MFLLIFCRHLLIFCRHWKTFRTKSWKYSATHWICNLEFDGLGNYMYVSVDFDDSCHGRSRRKIPLSWNSSVELACEQRVPIFLSPVNALDCWQSFPWSTLERLHVRPFFSYINCISATSCGKRTHIHHRLLNHDSRIVIYDILLLNRYQIHLLEHFWI